MSHKSTLSSNAVSTVSILRFILVPEMYIKTDIAHSMVQVFKTQHSDSSDAKKSSNVLPMENVM
jgi:hypothetical protein